MDFIKSWFIDEENKTGCRFVVVDSYNEEIPFEKVPARGFFDVTEERKNALDMRNDPKFLGADIEDVDEQRRDLVEERSSMSFHHLFLRLFAVHVIDFFSLFNIYII